MKLYLTATSERGKSVEKSANDRIEITLTIDRIPKYFIYFREERLIVENIPVEKEILRHER